MSEVERYNEIYETKFTENSKSMESKFADFGQQLRGSGNAAAGNAQRLKNIYETFVARFKKMEAHLNDTGRRVADFEQSMRRAVQKLEETLIAYCKATA